MNRWYRMTALVLVTFTLCGCIPRRLFWSPDGQYAAIIAEDGLRMCDAAGQLSEVVADEVRVVAWFPDSRRFVAARATKLANWEEAAVFLDPERRDALPQLADPLREEVLAYTGEWTEFRPKVLEELSDGELAALVLYVRDHRREGLPEKLGEMWQDIEKMTMNGYLLEVYETAGVGATPGRVLDRTVDAIEELRISPDERLLACVRKISQRDNRVVYRLSVQPAEGGGRRTVAEPVALFPDWATDGRSLVYATTDTRPVKGSDSLQLGSVVQRKVRNESGELLEEFADPEDLAEVVFGARMKIRCLPDGRILFAAMEVNLPSTAKDLPQDASLFSIDPARQPTVTRMVPREAEGELPDGLANGYFEASPDATRIAVSNDMPSEGRQTRISVLTLATGEVQSVVEQQGRLKSIPAWRTAEELSFFVPPRSEWGSADRYELVLWSGPDQVRCLSREWPAIFEKPADDSNSNSDQQ